MVTVNVHLKSAVWLHAENHMLIALCKEDLGGGWVGWGEMISGRRHGEGNWGEGKRMRVRE